MSIRKTVVLLMAGLAATACRDTEPFVLDRPSWPDSVALRLTLNPGDDRAPAWHTDDNSILYVAEGYAPYPARPGIVLSVPGDGGDADAFMEPVQFGVTSQPMLSAVAISDQRVALLQLTQFEQYECEELVCPTTIDLEGGHLQLREASLRIRRNDANTGLDESAFQVVFEGATVDSTRHPFNLAYVHEHITHPYHRYYNLYGDAFFRPTWSPDGQSVVFSNGLNLYRWQVGSPGVTVIPNTADAVWPAWSPDGQTIAFTRLRRVLAGNVDCFCVARGGVVSLYETEVYQDPGRIGQLVVVNVDGSNSRELGEGTAPAWTPDSRNIVAARGSGLFLIDVATGGSSLIPNTSGGTEPAISSDGNKLAFSRVTGDGTHDIWRIRLR